MLYAIGDIHGHTEKLDAALALIAEDGGDDASVVFLGDYVDRGPDSRGVIQRLIDGQAAGRPWRFVLGNHDRMFLRFVSGAVLDDDAIESDKGWLHGALGGSTTLASYMDVSGFLNPAKGGLDTLASYGLAPMSGTQIGELHELAHQRIPQDHIDFLRGLPLLIEDPDHIYVHAGLCPGVPLADQIEDDLIWIREPFLSHDGDFEGGKLVIHGHTPLEFPAHFGNRIDLDSGAAFGRPLVPGAFDGRDWFALTEEGRRPLLPAGAADSAKS